MVNAVDNTVVWCEKEASRISQKYYIFNYNISYSNIKSMPKKDDEKTPPSSFSFHDYIDRFTVAAIAVAVAGVAAAVVLRRRARL